MARITSFEAGFWVMAMVRLEWDSVLVSGRVGALVVITVL
jgi:hypothetical protein